MIKIYHNNRCSKSRQGLAILKEYNETFEVIDYLKNPPNVEVLKSIIEMLEVRPIELVRKNEQIWKDNYKNKVLSDNQIIDAMVSNPKLIERPIVIKGAKAVLGRPPENIKDLFN